MKSFSYSKAFVLNLESNDFFDEPCFSSSCNIAVILSPCRARLPISPNFSEASSCRPDLPSPEKFGVTHNTCLDNILTITLLPHTPRLDTLSTFHTTPQNRDISVQPCFFIAWNLGRISVGPLLFIFRMRPRVYQFFLALFAAFGSFLYGYEIFSLTSVHRKEFADLQIKI